MQYYDKLVRYFREVFFDQNVPNGDKREINRFASVNKTIGLFSNKRSRACDGRNPTYVSVFAMMSTYDAVLHREAASMSILGFW